MGLKDNDSNKELLCALEFAVEMIQDPLVSGLSTVGVYRHVDSVEEFQFITPQNTS